MGRILYLGTDPSRYPIKEGLIHLSLIQPVPLQLPTNIFKDFSHFTHVILTSPNAVQILLSQFSLKGKKIFAIGRGTAAQLDEFSVEGIASPESQEGMIALLDRFDLSSAHLFYPRSSLARPLLADYLKKRGLKHTVCDLYETRFVQPKEIPSLDTIDEIVFTSPTTVEAFLAVYGKIPQDKKLTCIGPVTQEALNLKR